MSYTPDEVTQLRRTVNRFGVCVGDPDPDAWFPPEPRQSGTDTPGMFAARRARYEREARALCHGCPVKAECLSLALWEERDEPPSCVHGVRGATAPWQRVRMRWNRVVASVCETVKEVA